MTWAKSTGKKKSSSSSTVGAISAAGNNSPAVKTPGSAMIWGNVAADSSFSSVSTLQESQTPWSSFASENKSKLAQQQLNGGSPVSNEYSSGSTSPRTAADSIAFLSDDGAVATPRPVFREGMTTEKTQKFWRDMCEWASVNVATHLAARPPYHPGMCKQTFMLQKNEWERARRTVPYWEFSSNWDSFPLKPEFQQLEAEKKPEKTFFTEKTPDELEADRIAAKIAALTPDERLLLCPYINNNGHATNPYHPFAGPPRNQQSPLLALLSNQVVSEKVFSYIMVDEVTSLNFSCSCRQAFDMIARYVAVWDITSGWYHWCENPRLGEAAKLVNPRHQGTVKDVVIVTPARGSQSKQGKRLLPNGSIPYRKDENGNIVFDWNEVGEQDLDDSEMYLNQVLHVYKLTMTWSFFGDFFTNLQLVRVPFLNEVLLALGIPHMPKLHYLKIQDCPLIHVGKAFRLLDIIKTDRPKGKENQVKLDFRPRFHPGPLSQPGNPYVVGSYGVTWDNWNGDSCLAIWAICYTALHRAKEQQQDWVSKGTLFRTWLDQGPCPKIEETLKVLMGHEPIDKFVAWVDYKKYAGDPKEVSKQNPWTNDNGAWKMNFYRCDNCCEVLPAVFFKYSYIRERRIDPRMAVYCYGCAMTNYLEGETDHYKCEKEEVLDEWLSEVDGEGNRVYNTTDLNKALWDFESNYVAVKAVKLDLLRRDDRNIRGYDADGYPLGYDHETGERQRPYTKSEKSGKEVAAKIRSPTIQEKYEFEKDIAGWTIQNRARLNRHGYS